MSKLYKRPTGIYYVRFRSKGILQWKSLKTANRREAEILRGKLDRIILAEKFHERQGAPPNPTLDDISKWYETWAIGRRQPDTVEQTKYFLYLFPQLTKVKHVRKITPQHLEQFQRACITQKNSPRTINKALTMLRAALNHAIRTRIYTGANPFNYYEKLRTTKRLPRWLSAKEIRAVMSAAKSHSQDAHLIFALGIYAGLRKDEILESRWDWINFDEKTLYVRGSETFQIKDASERAVDLSRSLLHILEKYCVEKTGYIIRPENPPTKDSYRFELRKVFDAVLKEAGVENCTPKTLRYTFASQLVQAGVELYYVQYQLGHSDANTTQIYAHLRPRRSQVDKIPVPRK